MISYISYPDVNNEGVIEYTILFADSDIASRVDVLENELRQQPEESPPPPSSATFNNCIFHDNSEDAISGDDNATIHLHGEATAIHSNGSNGIYAANISKVVIHLPSNHNTIYNNRYVDRYTINGGTITNVED